MQREKGLLDVVREVDRLLQQADEAAQGPGFMHVSSFIASDAECRHLFLWKIWGCIRGLFGFKMAGHRRFDEIKTKPTWPAKMVLM